MKKKTLKPEQLEEVQKLLELDKYKYVSEFKDIEKFKEQNQDNESDPEMYEPPEDTLLEYPLGVVTRADWGADFPIRTEPLLKPIKFIVPTYTTFTKRCCTLAECCKLVKWMQNRDVEDLAMTDIQPRTVVFFYGFLIGGDGRVYEGRGWDARPNDSIEYPFHNGTFLDIAFIGDHRRRTIPPTYAMFKAAMSIVKYGMKNKLLSENIKYL